LPISLALPVAYHAPGGANQLHLLENKLCISAGTSTADGVTLGLDGEPNVIEHVILRRVRVLLLPRRHEPVGPCTLNPLTGCSMPG
jgi:hypothetical protein